MNIIKWYKVCRKQGHHMVFDRPTLGGEYIKCKECDHLDEYLPGLHEPKGYNESYKKPLGVPFYPTSMDMVPESPKKRPKANLPPSIWN